MLDQDWWIGGLVDWWIGGLMGCWIGGRWIDGLMDWWTGLLDRWMGGLMDPHFALARLMALEGPADYYCYFIRLAIMLMFLCLSEFF